MRKSAILYSCYYQGTFDREKVVEEHALTFIQSGTVRFTTPDGLKNYQAGDMVLVSRNQLARGEKSPGSSGDPFKSVTIYLTQDALRRYAAEKGIDALPRYSGPRILGLTPNAFLSAFFASLLPYYDHPGSLTPALQDLKTTEAIELLLSAGPALRGLLFDFSEPHKIDLESFMLKNFEFNVALTEFARLSGRSLSTFKRDFQKAFALTPEKWLKTQRLEKAYYLIKEKHQKASDVYLRVGFENLSHFSTAFKELYGVNPSAVGER
ncbi:helix-turn-helix domain-containing protein [Flavihumibacter petaseus]|uniref:Putative AraC family transcriptional regulator n=1 Tax=Flavihumibacter petaseus NBRC 106054 TaxID=1220578 RepID=A0A0E9N2I5_9BACT|nr:AraC family transcriptional regulator [Flavihumibacter petaseus]GAO44054.1 putative AraC family transcriptional regulator [Flavihumibacter petaseus NBRC 106054]